MGMYRKDPETGRVRILRAFDAARLRAEFARTCEVWVAPPHPADSVPSNYVCEVYPDGYTAYRSDEVIPSTGTPYHDPTGMYVERVGWLPNFWSNIDHVRAEHENMLRDCGYVRML